MKSLIGPKLEVIKCDGPLDEEIYGVWVWIFVVNYAERREGSGAASLSLGKVSIYLKKIGFSC